MLFYVRVTVNQGDLSNEELWSLWEKEISVAKKAHEHHTIVDAYKVIGSKEVIIIYNAKSHDEIDRAFTAQLPLTDYMTIKEITPVRPYFDFAEDVMNRWQKN